MSTYRRLDSTLPIAEDIRGEVYPFRITRNAKKAEPAASSTASGTEEAYKGLRKAAPANVALPRTLAWCESLPPRVRPVALMRQFARIANVIAAAWDDIEQFETYMESLLTDKRGRRKGFPGDVLAELTALDVYRHTVTDCASPWLGVGKRG